MSSAKGRRKESRPAGPRAPVRSFAAIVAFSLSVAALIALPLACGSDGRGEGEDGASALLYHSISNGTELSEADAAYAVEPGRFRQQMNVLARDGYRTISVGDLARLTEGDTTGIPGKPLVLTFDDGYRSSWVATDRILARLGFEATIFLEVEKIGDEPNYLNWNEVRTMFRNGRWNPQIHNGRLNQPVVYGPRPEDTGPPYAYRARGETLLGWRARVSGDLRWAIRKMEEELPRWEPEAWAVPFGNYGQRSTNDVAIQEEILGIASRYFPVIFGENCGSFIPEGAEPPFSRLQVVEPLATLALTISQLPQFTGRDAPTVIT